MQHKMLTASLEKIYFILDGVTQPKNPIYSTKCCFRSSRSSSQTLTDPFKSQRKQTTLASRIPKGRNFYLFKILQQVYYYSIIKIVKVEKIRYNYAYIQKVLSPEVLQMYTILLSENLKFYDLPFLSVPFYPLQNQFCIQFLSQIRLSLKKTFGQCLWFYKQI